MVALGATTEGWERLERDPRAVLLLERPRGFAGPHHRMDAKVDNRRF